MGKDIGEQESMMSLEGVSSTIQYPLYPYGLDDVTDLILPGKLQRTKAFRDKLAYLRSPN